MRYRGSIFRLQLIRRLIESMRDHAVYPSVPEDMTVLCTVQPKDL